MPTAFRQAQIHVALALLIVLAGATAIVADRDSAFASEGCQQFQGFDFCYYGDQTSPPPPGMVAFTVMIDADGYTHPCVYASWKIGSTWYPQGDLCSAPYGDDIDLASSAADCVYGEHWVKDAVNSSTRYSSYFCP